MKTTGLFVFSLGLFGLTACGASDDSSPTDGQGPGSSTFNPPPVQEGYTRFEAPVVKDITPGTDISYCQFVLAPVDRDMDILDVTGFQSKGGHHSLGYSVPFDEPVGTSRICTEDDDMQLGFVGGTGGEGTAVTLPEGVAFRLPKGSGIMLNTHFLNSYGETLEGHTVIDFKFAEADPSRKIASFFSHGTTDIQIPAQGRAEASTECVIRDDMEFIFFTSHLHEYGSFGQTELVRAGATASEMVHSGDWIPEYQAAPQWSVWDKAAPLKFKAGDTVRTTCRWENTTAEAMTFPREMCFGIGFFLTDVPAAPVCLDGAYL